MKIRPRESPPPAYAASGGSVLDVPGPGVRKETNPTACNAETSQIAPQFSPIFEFSLLGRSFAAATQRSSAHDLHLREGMCVWLSAQSLGRGGDLHSWRRSCGPMSLRSRIHIEGFVRKPVVCAEGGAYILLHDGKPLVGVGQPDRVGADEIVCYTTHFRRPPDER